MGVDRVASPLNTASTPKVWVLLGKGVGGNRMMQNLAETLGWPFELTRLRYNPLQLLPNPVLGARCLSLARKQSDGLLPPWPDLVIAASRRSAPIARWIKRQARGRTRLVHLLHAHAPLHDFDLVITLPQYRLPAARNVVELDLTLNPPSPAAIAAAAHVLAPRYAASPRPLIALLVGGDSSSFRLDAASAARLATLASTVCAEAGGSLLVSTSPRTSAHATKALCAALDGRAEIFRWRQDAAENPYLAWLGLADHFIVTADSASQISEACATGKPVAVFGWGGAADRAARHDGRLRRALIAAGWYKPRRDFDAFLRRLHSRGLIHRLGEAPPRQPSAAVDEMPRVIERIRGLMHERGHGYREEKRDASFAIDQ